MNASITKIVVFENNLRKENDKYLKATIFCRNFVVDLENKIFFSKEYKFDGTSVLQSCKIWSRTASIFSFSKSTLHCNIHLEINALFKDRLS